MQYQRRRVSRESNKPKKDWLLVCILLFFNLWSGFTTIFGARQILPDNIAWICGITVQVMLFFLLSKMVMRASVFRRWMAILVFTIVSIYTSFFCYYSILTSDVAQVRESNLSLDAHQELIASVYTPIENRSLSLLSEIKKLEELAKKEEESGIDTGFTGCGPRCRFYIKEAELRKAEYDEISRLLKVLEPKFKYEAKKLSPDKIYQRDREALSSVPYEWKKNFTIEYEDYIDADREINFLTPYIKIVKSQSRDGSAILSLLISICVDGISILQGTAIERKEKKEGYIENFANKLSSFIRSIYRALDMISNSFNRKSELDLTSLDSIVNSMYDSCKSESKVITFLMLLKNSIDVYYPYMIDLNKIEESEQIFREAFKDILNVLSDKNCIEINNTPTGNICILRREYANIVFSWIQSKLNDYSLKNLSYQQGKVINDNNYSGEELDINDVDQDWGRVFKSWKER